MRKISNQMINVMLVDDHALFLSGLKSLLEKEDNIGEVIEVQNAEKALELLEEHDIDVVLMDIGLPGMDGLTASRLIKEKKPFIKIIVLTMHDDEPYLLKALEADASGFILKEAAATELVSAIQAVMEGEVVIHPTLVKVLVKENRKQETDEKQAPEEKDILTKREKEVLRYICLGYTNQEISEFLVVSPKTVEKHKSNIMEKLELKRRHQLVKYAIKTGLIELS